MAVVPSTLVLPVVARRLVERASRAARPAEACGCLLGVVAGEAVVVDEATSGANVARASRDRTFELDPGAIVAAEDAARRAGRDLVGFWHSHPRGHAKPSAADARMAWSGRVALILGLAASGRAAWRAWIREPARTGRDVAWRELEVRG